MLALHRLGVNEDAFLTLIRAEPYRGFGVGYLGSETTAALFHQVSYIAPL